MSPLAIVDKPKYSDNEKVMCFHGLFLYEAKCLKSKKSDTGEFQYRVHYLGWNKNWDEWVPESRVFKFNEETLEKKTQLQQEHAAAAKEQKKVSGGTRSTGKRAAPPVLGDEGDHEENDSSDETTEKMKCSSNQEREREGKEEGEECRFRIRLPLDLKYVLVSDWDLMVHKKSLFNLPAKISAASIIGDFVKHVEKTKEKSKALLVAELMQGIKEFFNEAMERGELLYKVEKNQYVQQRNGGKAAVDLYGSAHLLRLTVKLNSMLHNETCIKEEADILLIESTITDFLSYLEEHRQRFFSSKNYAEATEDYLKAVQ